MAGNPSPIFFPSEGSANEREGALKRDCHP